MCLLLYVQEQFSMLLHLLCSTIYYKNTYIYIYIYMYILFIYMCIYYLYIYTLYYLYIYIYITYIYIYIYILFIYIYIHINSEKNSDILNLLYNQTKSCFSFLRMAICILFYHEMRFGTFEL